MCTPTAYSALAHAMGYGSQPAAQPAASPAPSGTGAVTVDQYGRPTIASSIPQSYQGNTHEGSLAAMQPAPMPSYKTDGGMLGNGAQTAVTLDQFGRPVVKGFVAQQPSATPAPQNGQIGDQLRSAVGGLFLQR